VVSDAESQRVVVLGEVDLASANQFEQEIVSLLDGGNGRLVLDLSQLTFMDVAGIRALVRCHQRAVKLGTNLQLIPGSSEPRRILELCGLLDAFQV
jgi:anti-sigma B factor antagonist